MSTIIDLLTAAIRARKDTLVALRGRIAELVEPIPVGVVLSDDQGEVGRIVRVCTSASQWSNRTWEVTIRGTGLMSGNAKLICDNLDDSYWDGNNRHTRGSEPTCRGGREGDILSYEPGRTTRELAARLPVAIARYKDECKAEAERNAQATASI